MVLESFIIINGKGIDVNGELPFMAFGTLFVAGMPPLLGLLGAWEKNWYWYILIAFMIMSGFTAYIRSRGFAVRMFNYPLKFALQGVEKALKQAKAEFQKDVQESREGPITRYIIGDGKYPLLVFEKKRTPLNAAHVEITAPEALWNKELQHELMVFVNLSRKNLVRPNAMKGTRPRLIVGMVMVLLGIYLFTTAKIPLL